MYHSSLTSGRPKKKEKVKKRRKTLDPEDNPSASPKSLKVFGRRFTSSSVINLNRLKTKPQRSIQELPNRSTTGFTCSNLEIRLDKKSRFTKYWAVIEFPQLKFFDTKGVSASL